MTNIDHAHPILVLGGTGTVGGRVVDQLRGQGVPVRPASRHTAPRFDWADPGTWDAVLAGVRRAYLLLPDDVGLPEGFVERALAAGIERVVLHSDRGAEVMGVTRLLEAEAAVRQFPEWTIVRADWFDQNFETFFRDAVIGGRLAVPVGEARQGFVDAADIAAVGVRALLDDDLVGRILELTGPEALSFREATRIIGEVIGHDIEFDGTAGAYREQMTGLGLPDEVVEGLIAGFAALAARGDTRPTGVVEAVLGRPARSLRAYAENAAARGVWGSQRPRVLSAHGRM
jgi:uncharacterized protein YbjT (DUF2867 family)